MQVTMQLNLSARVQARVTRGASPSLPLQRLRRSTVVRAEGDDKPTKGSEINAGASSLGHLSCPACPPRRITARSEPWDVQDDVKIDRSKVENIEPGNISNEAAEMRADIGKDRPPTFTEAQAFDGPAPETINVGLSLLPQAAHDAQSTVTLQQGSTAQSVQSVRCYGVVSQRSGLLLAGSCSHAWCGVSAGS